MATTTLTEQDEPQNVWRNAPRTSDTITRRGHHGPVPLPTESAFILIGNVPGNSPGTAPMYASPAHPSYNSMYQTPGQQPHPNWTTQPAYHPTSPSHGSWYQPYGPGSQQNASLGETGAYLDRSRGAAPTTLSNHPSLPLVHMSFAEYSSTPARPQAARYSSPHGVYPRPDPLATPRGQALEAWRLFRLLGEHAGADVPTDPTDGFTEIIAWLRYFAVSVQRGYMWARHAQFFSDMRASRKLADLLRVTRTIPETNGITFNDYDLTDLVSRAERSGVPPLPLLESEGVVFSIVEREPPIVIETEVSRHAYPHMPSYHYKEQRQFEPSEISGEHRQTTDVRSEGGERPMDLTLPEVSMARRRHRIDEADTSHIELGHIPAHERRQSTLWTAERLRQEPHQRVVVPPVPNTSNSVTELDYASDVVEEARAREVTRPQSREFADTLVATSSTSSTARRARAANNIELSHLDTPPHIARRDAETRERTREIQAIPPTPYYRFGTISPDVARAAQNESL